MREEGCDLRTGATFSDISLHGCYVGVTATADLGKVLQISPEAKGFRIETKGCVRVSYPALGMGIAFTEMSEANRTHLRKLLTTISQPSVIVGPGLASSLPVSGSLKAMPPISNPGAAVQALVEYFENRQMLTQEEFLRVLRKSQRDNPASGRASRV
jgi:PilZ domain-containing protein